MRRTLLTPLERLAAVPSPVQGYVTRQQLASEYHVAESTIALWQRRDALPVTRIGTQPVYERDKVATWFAARPDRMHGGH